MSKKKSLQRGLFNSFEPSTFCLRSKCSTTKLSPWFDEGMWFKVVHRRGIFLTCYLNVMCSITKRKNLFLTLYYLSYVITTISGYFYSFSPLQQSTSPSAGAVFATNITQHGEQNLQRSNPWSHRVVMACMSSNGHATVPAFAWYKSVRSLVLCLSWCSQ